MPADALPVPHDAAPMSLAGAYSLLPVGASTFTLTFGPYTDALGNVQFAGVTGKLVPVDPASAAPVNLTHATTGQVIIPVPLTITIAADGTSSVGPIPHTDDPSLLPTGWAYRVTWNLGSRRPSPGDRTFFVPLASGDTVDFDRLTTALAVPGVASSDAAVVALLNDPTSATYAKVLQLITARTGFGAGTP